MTRFAPLALLFIACATTPTQPPQQPKPQAQKPGKLVIRSPRNCRHGYTICATRECVESWSCDWNLYLRRTGGGRRLIELLELTDEEVDALCDDTNRPINELSIAVPGKLVQL